MLLCHLLFTSLRLVPDAGTFALSVCFAKVGGPQMANPKNFGLK
jgi:hypothetical protein